MTYTAAAALGVLAALTVDLLLLRTRLVTGVTFWATYPIIVFFQLLSNGLLTGLGVVRYDPASITGLRLVYAPVEDLAFGFALVLGALSVWAWLGDRDRGPAATGAEPDRDRGGGRPRPG